MAFDTTGGTYGNNNWDRPADLKMYLNETYLPAGATKQDKIVSHTWGIGKITPDNSNLAGQIADENRTQSQSVSVGMITASDYLRANTNTKQCGNMSINNTNRTTCLTTNWTYSIVPSNDYLWTILPSVRNSFDVFMLYNGISYPGSLNTSDAYGSTRGVFPVVYLKSDIILSESGTEDNPFIIE